MTNIKHASDNTHTQENGTHYFHKLRKLQDKILRYSTHLDTYQKHITAGTTPKGLRIHTTPWVIFQWTLEQNGTTPFLTQQGNS